MKKNSIKYQLIKFVAIILLVAFIVGAIINFYIIQDSFHRNINNQLQFMAKYLKDEFKINAKLISKELSIMSNTEALQRYFQNFQANMITSEFLKHTDIFDKLAFLNKENKIITKIANGKLSQYKCSPKAVKIRDNLIKKSQKTFNKVVYSEIVYCESFEAPSIFFAISKTNYFDEYLGTIVGVISIDKFLHKIDSYLNKELITRIINYENKVVYSPFESEILKIFVSDNSLLNGKMKQNNIMGIKSFTYLLDLDNNKIVITIPYSYYENLLFEFLEFGVVGFIIVFLLSLFIIGVVSTKITKPLNDLVDKIKYFRKTDFETGIQNDSYYYEIHTLIVIFNKLGKRLKKERKALYNFNENLKQMVEDEVEKNRIQEKKLIQQSKLAAMGEMMDAIAHQWKQPINTIKVVVSGIEVQKDFGTLTDEYLFKVIQNVYSQVDHLTETIDEFRKFFRPNQPREIVNIKNAIESVNILMKDTLVSNQIKIKIDGDDLIEYKLIATEFKHIFINLINNAKDAFLEESTKYKKDSNICNKLDSTCNHTNRKIIFNIFIENNLLKITVTDNAGGIPQYIIGDIFKVNLTTKEDGKGTGVGLYLVTQILNKLDGTIDVENVTYKDEDGIQKGARFIISLPIA